MVQENHQEKLKIIIFQYIMLTYFISLNMNDPVGGDSPMTPKWVLPSLLDFLVL